MTESDVSALVARAVSGEPAAFTNLVREHHGLLMRWALVLEGDADDAEDLAQAVWIKVHRSLASYRGASKFTTWLYRIASNTSVELHRTQDRRKIVLAAWRDGADGPDTFVEARDAVDAHRLASVVMSLLAHLPPRQRQVFTLADLEGRSHGEIADMLEIPQGTVRTNLFRARRAIRTRILLEEPRLIEEFRS